MKRLLALILTAALLLSLLPAALAAEPEEPAFSTQPKLAENLALLENGTVYHWSDTDYDIYPGPGNYHRDEHPVQLAGLERIVDIAPEMALDADGHVWTWGYNSAGQLGDGTTRNRNEPAMVAGLENVTAIAAGETTKAAVTADGSLYLWGSNRGGQLGMAADYQSHPTPVKLEGLDNVQAVALGSDHALALLEDGTVWAWGSNAYGQLGSDRYTSTPAQVEGLADITGLVSGHDSCFALAEDGTVWAWGFNQYGQLGYPVSQNTPISNKYGSWQPRQMPGLENITRLASGQDYTLALDADGRLWACGLNYYGDFGNQPPIYQMTGTAPAILIDAVTQPAVDVAIGARSVLLMEDGVIQSPGGGDTSALSLPFSPMTYADGLTFCADRYPLHITAQPGGNTTGLSTGLYQPGEALTLYAVPQLGSTWAGWAAEGVSLSDPQGATLSLSMPNGPAELTAQFETAAGVDTLPLLSGGYSFTTALRSDGTVWAWGSNVSGQLGLGDNTDASHPAAEQVSRSNGVVSLASGATHSLVAEQTGSHYVWGDNSAGQLALSNADSKNTPTYSYDAAGKILSAGEQYSMGLSIDQNDKSTVYYWGYDIVNGTGNLTRPEKLTLMDGTIDMMPRNVVDISAGAGAALLLCRDGTVWTVGLGSTLKERQPRQVEGLPYITAISAGGSHFLALGQDGTVWAWGSNNYGQLGNGTTQSSDTPVAVEGLSRAVFISAGGGHSAAVTAEGELWTWGQNTSGQLGDGTTQDSATPIQVRSSVTYAWAGYAQTFYADAGGYLYGCGFNGNGELGSGDLLTSAQYVPVVDSSGQPFSLLVYPLTIGVSAGGGAAAPLSHYPAGATVTVTATPNRGYTFQQWQAQGVELGDSWDNPAQFTMPANPVTLTPTFASDGTAIAPALAAGYTHTLLRNDGGTVYGWGSNSMYCLGGSHSEYPDKIDSIRDVAQIGAGASLSAFLLSDGTVWYLGQLYQNDFKATPAQLEGLSGITAIAVGNGHILALKEDGTVWGVGQNRYGCLTGTEDGPIAQPFQIEGLSRVTHIWAGYYGSAAKTEDGTVYVWGDNRSGQFGAGESTLSTPTPLDWDGDISSLAIGSNFCAALLSDGTVWACGSNSSGQLGNNAQGTSSTTPVQVQDLSGITAISAGGSHALALDETGALWAWGSNSYGQLGGGLQTQAAPVQVAEDVGQMDAGHDFSLIVKSDGTVWACGYNGDRQLAMTTGSNSLNRFAQCRLSTQTMSAHAYSVTIQAENGGKVRCKSLADTADPVEQAYNFYLAGTTLTVEAVPDQGWLFDGWTAQGVTLYFPNSTSPSLTVPAGAVVLTAHFRQDGTDPGPDPGTEPGTATKPTGLFLADVTAPDPGAIPISDGATLAKIGADPSYPLDGSYVLTGDLELSDMDSWTPIGTLTDPFTGTFDGGGHVVRGLTVTYAPDGCAGLFGAAAQGAAIQNLGVEQASIRPSYAIPYAGAIVGKLEGPLTNCYATGTVTVTGTSGTSVYAGGLAGYAASLQDCYNRAAVRATGGSNVYAGGIAGYVPSGKYTVTRCLNDGPVSTNDTANNSYCGGIAGWLGGGLTVSQCRNTAPVTASTFYSASGRYCVLGGIAGYCASPLTDCYNRGSVDGGDMECYTAYSGGIAGLLDYTTSPAPSLEQCYNAGDVAAGSYYTASAGGLFGMAQGFTPAVSGCVVACRYVDAYYNYFSGSQGGVGFYANALGQASGSFSGLNRYLSGLSNRGYSSAVKTNDAAPINTAALSDANTYAALGWDFNTLWTVDTKRNGGLPHFTWEYTGSVWISGYDRDIVTLQVSRAVDGALLCAASYEGERLVSRATMAVDLEPGTQSFYLPTGSASHFKVFLLDAQTLEPICYPWSK